MRLPLPTKAAAFALMAGLATSSALAQDCLNTSAYGTTTVDPTGALTTISTCSYLSEYSTVNGAFAGGNYEFTVTGGGYITVREGSSSGTVIAQGYSPVTATATANGTLFPHWNVDDQCATITGCQTTTVQLLLDCDQPSANVSAVDDCANNQFSLNVDVTGLGDGTDVDLVYNVNGGENDTLFDQPVGSYVLGPFTVGQTVNLVVTHSSDAMCNLNFPGLVSQNTCPTIIACGGEPYDASYCYVNSDNNHWLYQSDNGMPLIMIFSAGSIENPTWDHLRVYDGTDNTGALLYENPVGTTAQLAGLQFVGASGSLYMEMSSDGSVSCFDGSQSQWVWQVGCLDCNPAVVDYTVNTDCDAQTFTIDVHVTSVGSDPTLDITNNAGAATITATDTGVYTVGPFPITTPVTITMVNENNSLCNVVSPVLTNPLCATHVVCGEPALQETYCYTNSDVHAWHWQNTDPGSTLALLFSAGTIEWPGIPWGDNLTIYDGADNTAPVLYQNLTNVDLTGMLFISTGDHLYMELTTSTFGSCFDGFVTEWAWQVACYDCAPVAATYTINTDCDAQTFTIDVDVTDMGSQTTFDILNDAGAPTLTATATGVYTVGPFPITTETVITLENDTNSLCTVNSGVLTNPLCPTHITCGQPALQQNYCYTNNDVHAWHWQNTDPGGTLALLFSAGTIEWPGIPWGDNLTIYDGADNTAPVLFQNLTNVDLTGMLFLSTGDHLYMELTTSDFGSCFDGWTTEWAWQVGCYDCAPATATYTVNTDCDAQSFTIDVDITDMGSQTTLDILNDAGAPTVTATGTGVYNIGPFPITTETVITLENDTNSLCSVHSDVLTNPLCPSFITCGGAPLDLAYCYPDNDYHQWHWQAGTDGLPLIIIFSGGSIESATWDQLLIYDGPDNTGTLLYANPIGSTTDLTGMQFVAPSGHIYMEVTSEGSVSCGGGSMTEWAWQVGCLDCVPATVNFVVVTDCDAMQYSVEVNITALGSDEVLDITNNGGALPVAATAAGTYTVGPFAAGTPVVITLENDENSLCNVTSPILTNPLCPTIVTCGGASVADTYCYQPTDNHEWHWQASGNVPLAIDFSAGTIENNFWDDLTIYDGPDASGTVIWANGTTTTSLDTIPVLIASSGHIYMTVTSDFSVSCGDGSMLTWAWEVSCLDCTNPAADFSVVEDCIHNSYSVAVNVTDLGSGAFARIGNNFNTDTLTNIPAGITMVGPFPMDTAVVLTVFSETNNLCKVISPELNFNSSACVDSVCAPAVYEYCYPNNDIAWFTYQGLDGVALTVEFLAGTMLPGDFVQIYNGLAPIPANQLWQGNLLGNLAGWAVNTTNGYSSMLVRVLSNATGSCATGETPTPLNWVVQCGSVNVNEVAAAQFTIYPNPTTGEFMLQLPQQVRGTANLQVTDLSGRIVHQETFASNGTLRTFDLNGLQSGNYMVTITTNDWVKAQQLQIIR